MKAIDIQLSKVDHLGMLLAQIADLEKQAEAIKNKLKQQEGHIEGNLFKACVTLSQRATVDNKAVFAEANVPAELIASTPKLPLLSHLK